MVHKKNTTGITELNVALASFCRGQFRDTTTYGHVRYLFGTCEVSSLFELNVEQRIHTVPYHRTTVRPEFFSEFSLSPLHASSNRSIVW